MANVYSTQFWDAHAVTGLAYEVPTGFVAVLRYLTLFYSGGLGAQVQLVLAPATTILFQGFNPAATGQWNDHDIHVVVNPGQLFSLAADDGVDVSLSGYLLSLP